MWSTRTMYTRTLKRIQSLYVRLISEESRSRMSTVCHLQLRSRSLSSIPALPKESAPSSMLSSQLEASASSICSPSEYCREILDDPLCDVSMEETARFVLPYPNSDRTHILDVLTRPFRTSYMFEPASVMIHLCVERLENTELTDTFEIGPGFNRRAYFLFLHVWLLHRRAMKECPLGILLDRYLFRCAFDLLNEWLVMRGVAEHRFKRERDNCQSFMMKFLVELDQCTLDEELYAYKLSRALHYHLYEESVSDSTLRLLVKYILRQFTHVSNLSSQHFLDAMFLWADNEAICKPQRLLKRAMPQLVKYGGESQCLNSIFIVGYQPPQPTSAAGKIGPGVGKISA